MISITDYPVHQTEADRWGTDAELFKQLKVAFGESLSKADTVFRYLNRPLPKGVKPDDLIDCSAALPEPLTIDQLGERAGKTAEEIQERIESRFLYEEYKAGTDSKGRPKFYWSQIGEWLTCELLTVNKAAEIHDVDRRTLKKHVERKLRLEHIFDPLTDKQGGGEYQLFWPDDIEFICKNDIKTR